MKALFIIIGLTLFVQQNAHAQGLHCNTAYTKYYLPGAKAINAMKYVGSTEPHRIAVVETCIPVRDKKRFLEKTECMYYPHFNGQMRQLVKDCEFYLSIYKDEVIKLEKMQAAEAEKAAAAAKADEAPVAPISDSGSASIAR